MLHAEPAQMALARAVKNPQVVQRLGSPMRPGWFVTGNIHLNNDSGEADLEIPLIGQHGRAEIHVVAQKEFGRWHYKEMSVGSEDSDQVIDLLAPEPGIGKR